MKVAWLLALGTLAAAGDASAAPRVHEVSATPIYRRVFTTSTSGARTFATADLRVAPGLGCGTPDTVMVVTRPDGVEVMNDDCSSSERRSCVSASGAAGKWVVTVFAKKDSEAVTSPSAFALPDPYKHCGTTDIVVNGAVVDQDATFGGTTIENVSLSGTVRAQTVHLPAGADDTSLYVYTPSWQEAAASSDSGIGKAAAATVSLARGSKLVVGSFSQAASGRVALVINECTGDPDAANVDACKAAGRDGDGDNLSDALEAELGTDPRHHDTDRDGLFDFYEVIGRRTEDGEEELRRFGADPRRRDVFLELDREINDQGAYAHQVTHEEADVILEDPYLDLPRLPANPDGTRMVVLHVDTGEPCPTRPTLCGDWGGSGDHEMTYSEAREQGLPNFGAVRRGLYHYGYVTTGGSGQGGVGKSWFYASSPSTIAHELGHGLGLTHWGHGGAGYNAKPNYPSLMNYAFQSKLPVISEQRGRFSEGVLPALGVPVDELTWGDGSNLDYLTAKPNFFTVAGGWIDLDRDGRLGRQVLADAAPNRPTSGDLVWPHMSGAVDLDGGPAGCAIDGDGCRPTGGGDLGVDERRGLLHVAVPFRHGDGRVYPHVRSSGDDGATWSAWRNAPVLDGLSYGEPAIEPMRLSDGSERILVVFPDRGGRLHYQIADADTGVATGWTAVPFWPSGARARHATVTRVGHEIWMAWRDEQSSRVTIHRFDVGSQRWDGATPAMTSEWCPGMTVASDGNVYLLAAPTLDDAVLYRWDDETWSSTRVSVDLEQEVSTADEAQRLALEYVPLRSSWAVPASDVSGQLWAAWASHGASRDSWYLNRAVLQGFVAPGEWSASSWFRRYDASGDRPWPGHSVALARAGIGMTALYSSITWSTQSLRGTRLLPHADGIARDIDPLVDHDDAATISATLCGSAWFIVDDTMAQCRCDTGRVCAGARIPAFTTEETECVAE